MRKLLFILPLFLFHKFIVAQNPVAIPPMLTGTTFNLNVQNGVTQFYPGINTPTYGVNGNILGPTLVVNKGDMVTINVTNSLTGSGNSTTMHWHGMHVPAIYDGGPHQVIAQGATWSPQFQILNSAGTCWYHPHGLNKTDLHVSKGIAGFFIVKDSIENTLTLPRTYGVDDFPLAVQTKAFDVLNQIAISTQEDTAVMVNGTVKPYLDAPAQVIRLRLLNGSSMRTFNFGFATNTTFKMIATDSGLLDSAITLTRIRLAPGERAEILLDLQGMIGQTLNLKSFSSELPNGIYGADSVVGLLGGTIPDYDLNPLNGADFDILRINVVAQTGNPVTTMPTSLITNTPWTNYTVSRNFELSPDSLTCAECQVEGTFNINGSLFDMNVINDTIHLNTVEKWRFTNNTGIAHPMHIHDMYFYVLNINGNPVPNYMQGKKDVVLIMPQQYVEFITKFETYASESTPYMYHCHMLHHEDEGMMGSFVVIDTTSSGISEAHSDNYFSVYPNPATNELYIASPENIDYELAIFNSLGEKVFSATAAANFKLPIANWSNGLFFIQMKTNNKIYTQKFIKQ